MIPVPAIVAEAQCPAFCTFISALISAPISVLQIFARVQQDQQPARAETTLHAVALHSRQGTPSPDYGMYACICMRVAGNRASMAAVHMFFRPGWQGVQHRLLFWAEQ